MLAALLLALQDPVDLPRIVLTEDDTVIDRSCLLVVPEGAVIADGNGNGVVHITTAGVTVEFAPGALLRGSLPQLAPDARAGIGIRVRNAAGVTLRGAKLQGFRAGVWASNAPGLTIEDAEIRDGFAQRLRSNDQAEDGADWLWPHRNDDNEWLVNYGAAVYVEDSDQVTLRRLQVRGCQNGICLDRVNESRIYDNDASFLSGWGLALWRSSRNVVSRNAFDFCIRGYSHGVYARGQDSAGILMFEQCSRNVIAENSATHGGDGFFGFAGREALGEAPAPAGFTHARAGNNENLLIGNDFSYAAAIGIEMTFSFGNRLVDNWLRGGNYGVWAGYSQDTVIAGNVIEDNVISGVAIEHGSGQRVLANRFARNPRGVELWWDVDPSLFALPWFAANHRGTVDNLVAHNQFDGDGVGVELRRAGEAPGANREFAAELRSNRMSAVAQAFLVLGDAPPPRLTEEPEPAWERPQPALFGDRRPVGARAALRGREHIVLTEWGPWDHESPLLRRAAERGGAHVYVLHGMAGRPRVELVEAAAGVTVRVEDGGAPGEYAATVQAPAPGLYSYRLRVAAANFQGEAAGHLMVASWQVRAFAWEEDPRTRLAAWRAEAEAAPVAAELPALRLPFGYGGPPFAVPPLPADRFGILASAKLPLPPGRYRIVTVSDDGVRVFVNGQQFLERWDVHAPTRDEAIFELAQAAEVELRVEHFENDGYAHLELALEPAP